MLDPSRLTFVTLALLALLPGCKSMGDFAAERHAGEYRCRRRDVTVEYLGANSYRATGCGYEAVYVCVPHGNDAVCARDSELNALGVTGNEARPAGAATMRVDVRTVLACVPGVSRLHLRFSVGTDGRVRSVERQPEIDDAVHACLTRAVAGRTVAAPSSEPRTLGGDFVAPADARPTTGGQGASSDAPPTGEAAIRAALDAHAGDITTCASRPTVAVHVSWDAAGRATVALEGDLAGRPQEGCVRAAVGALPVPSGASGEVLHLVRAPAH